jgi:hypothetical protein
VSVIIGRTGGPGRRTCRFRNRAAAERADRVDKTGLAAVDEVELVHRGRIGLRSLAPAEK